MCSKFYPKGAGKSSKMVLHLAGSLATDYTHTEYCSTLQRLKERRGRVTLPTN
jgi:hypothetical protein